MEEKNNQGNGKPMRISKLVMDFISPKIVYPETFSDALERLLKLKKETPNVNKRTAPKNK